ncbi:unnamed protein product, partial [Nesidiocoris tenuis]
TVRYRARRSLDATEKRQREMELISRLILTPYVPAIYVEAGVQVGRWNFRKSLYEDALSAGSVLISRLFTRGSLGFRIHIQKSNGCCLPAIPFIFEKPASMTLTSPCEVAWVAQNFKATCMTKVTRRPALGETVPIWRVVSRCLHDLAGDGQMSRFKGKPCFGKASSKNIRYLPTYGVHSVRHPQNQSSNKTSWSTRISERTEKHKIQLPDFHTSEDGPVEHRYCSPHDLQN